jgi:hypothetical protein
MQERSKMLAPLKRSIPEPDLLPDVRLLLNLCPKLADYPERLAAELKVKENSIRACLEALRVEDKMLA